MRRSGIPCGFYDRICIVALELRIWLLLLIVSLYLNVYITARASMLTPFELLITDNHFFSRGIYSLLPSSFMPSEIVSAKVFVVLQCFLQFVFQSKGLTSSCFFQYGRV